MPIDRAVGAQYAQLVIDLYLNVERDLAAVIADRLKRGLADDSLTAKLLAASEIRRAAEAAMRKIDGKLAPAVRRALHDAAVAGGRAAQEDLLRIRDRRSVGRRLGDLDRNLVNSPSILRLASTLAPGLEERLRSTHLQVVRSAGDIYQQAVAAGAAPGVLAGISTRREATQKALDHLWQQGVTGFVDRAGRRWNLASYVEMATRSTTAQAAVQAHLDQLSQQGMDLVQVSADGAPCPACRPWEGKVLSTGGGTGAQVMQRPSALTGETVTVHVDGTVSQATAAGLFHPSCRHRLTAYLPGVTTPIATAGDGAATYAAEQVQRRLEREARRLAVRQAGAVDPAEARRLASAYRAKRAEIKKHVQANPGLRRKTERERIDLGHTPSPVKAASPPAPQPPPRPAPKPPQPAPAPPPASVPAPVRAELPPLLARKVEGLSDAAARRRIAEAIVAQQEVAPNAVRALRGVRDMTDDDREREKLGPSAVAFYLKREIAMAEHVFGAEFRNVSADCQRRGFWVKTDADGDPAQDVFAHEFGHHIDKMLSLAPQREINMFWELVAEQIGVEAPSGELGFRGFTRPGIDRWINENRLLMSRMISGYGVTESRELLAEIWCEYTRKADPRPWVKRIGDAMKNLAEKRK